MFISSDPANDIFPISFTESVVQQFDTAYNALIMHFY